MHNPTLRYIQQQQQKGQMFEGYVEPSTIAKKMKQLQCSKWNG